MSDNDSKNTEQPEKVQEEVKSTSYFGQSVVEMLVGKKECNENDEICKTLKESYATCETSSKCAELNELLIKNNCK